MGKGEKTKQFIIEKSADLFNQKGFHGTRIEDIMQATGLTKGGIYGCFKPEGEQDTLGVKEKIAVAAFERAVQRVYEAIGERTGVIENALDKLKAVIYFYRERLLNPPVEGGCPIQNTAVEADDANPLLREKVVEAIAAWQRRIVRTLEKGIEKGEVKPGTNLEEFATVFIGNLEGGILLSRIQRNIQPFEMMAKQTLRLIETLRNSDNRQ